MTVDEFKTLTKGIRERWPAWEASSTEVKDLQNVFMSIRYTDAEDAVFAVRTKYSSDVPKLPWFVNAIKEIDDKRKEQRDHESHIEECERIDFEEYMLEQRVKAGHKQMLEFLAQVPRETLSQAVSTCITKQYIPAGDYSDANDWSRFSVGMVYAYLNR